MTGHRKCLLVTGLIALGVAGSANARELVQANPCVADVTASIHSMVSAPRASRVIQTEGYIPGRFYTQDPRAAFGIANHFQGVVSLLGEPYFVLSGGVQQTKQGHLFVVESGTAESRIVGRIDLPATENWHPGGLSRLGDLVAVPLENSPGATRSEVAFYDFSDPLSPRKLPARILRPHRGSDSVALERLEDGRFLIVINRLRNTEVHYSKSLDLSDGFGEPLEILQSPAKRLRGEGISILRQCDGKLFVLDFQNLGLVPAMLPGPNVLGLFELVGVTGSPSDRPELRRLERHLMRCGPDCNFSAAVGLAPGPSGEIRLQSSRFFRTLRGDRIRFAEFESRGSR